ncbi:MAG: 3-keto-5-aminohexanoate cleavage protein [Candidatus Binatia bacterium]
MLAPSNAVLVEKAIKIVQTMGGEIATPVDARETLGLAAR